MLIDASGFSALRILFTVVKFSATPFWFQMCFQSSQVTGQESALHPFVFYVGLVLC